MILLTSLDLFWPLYFLYYIKKAFWKFWNQKYPSQTLKFTISNVILKPEVPFRNRKYLFKSGSSVKNHDFQLSNMFWRALRVKTLESDFKF